MLTKSIVKDEIYKINDFVYVNFKDKLEQEPREKSKPDDYGVAKILEIRAKKPQFVYALVSRSSLLL